MTKSDCFVLASADSHCSRETQGAKGSEHRAGGLGEDSPREVSGPSFRFRFENLLLKLALRIGRRFPSLSLRMGTFCTLRTFSAVWRGQVWTL